MEHKKNRHTKWFAASLMGGLFLLGAVAGAKDIEPAQIPELMASLKIPAGQNFCGEPVPMDNPDVRVRFERELLLALWNRPQVILWLKRSGRYFPHMERLLKKNGLPDDLKYVAVAESALRPHAGSSRGAIGFWQFVRATGRRYGLTINDRIDERRNLFASTRAAIRYFKALHEEMGSWTLAAAAYNMGEKGLLGEILAQDSMNYYDLYLPLETQHFLFRILAIKLIFSDPKRYGFDLSKEEFYPLLSFDRVQLKCDRETPIKLVAKAAKTRFKVIKDLNPEIRGHYISKGDHDLLIPKGSLEGFQKRYAGLLKDYAENQTGRVYVVQSGDNLSTIARRHNVPVTALFIWNRINPRDPIHPGQKLIVHPGE
ncbi:MAG TPA: transglycosylase SLT domain-containing protein [Desulfobacteria bacterium]|nr:transglycosylase SLT domain-containing protein [Desulfobacteria bacterium]